MPARKDPTRNFKDRLFEKACEQLPNCTKALALVETGSERDLSLKERVALKYHGRLCPFCACATGKYESAITRMREAQALRRTGSSAKGDRKNTR